ncbi:MAG TPA: hypothetical protein VL171_07250 [Verrucomicrobiae bacterium]|nr:hypothetical protein [Verrucomicrobiae bacterium]
MQPAQPAAFAVRVHHDYVRRQSTRLAHNHVRRTSFARDEFNGNGHAYRVDELTHLNFCIPTQFVHQAAPWNAAFFARNSELYRMQQDD